MCIIAGVSYVRRRALPLSAPSSLPPISILKPLKGTDPEMYQSFRSHCIQNYSEYEVLFGISDPHDPAAEIVKRLQQEFPNRRIELVHCDSHRQP
jgi:ceramide glucosyltransferase